MVGFHIAYSRCLHCKSSLFPLRIAVACAAQSRGRLRVAHGANSLFAVRIVVVCTARCHSWRCALVVFLGVAKYGPIVRCALRTVSASSSPCALRVVDVLSAHSRCLQSIWCMVVVSVIQICGLLCALRVVGVGNVVGVLRCSWILLVRLALLHDFRWLLGGVCWIRHLTVVGPGWWAFASFSFRGLQVLRRG